MKVDQEKLNSFLKRIKASPCTLCGNNNWSVSDTIFQTLEFDAGGLRLGGTASYPIIPITCSKCGNTIFINALVAGLVDQNGIRCLSPRKFCEQLFGSIDKIFL